MGYLLYMIGMREEYQNILEKSICNMQEKALIF